MNILKPSTYTQNKKLLCDWTDKIVFLILCRMLKFFVRYGMIVDRVYDKFSFGNGKGLEKKFFDIQKTKLSSESIVSK